MGPLIRSHAIGGPACNTVSGVMPGTTVSGAPRSEALPDIARSDEAPCGEGGDAVARAHDDADLAQGVLLRGEALRVRVGPDDVRDHGELAARPILRSGEDGCQRSRRVGMRAV